MDAPLLPGRSPAGAHAPGTPLCHGNEIATSGPTPGRNLCTTGEGVSIIPEAPNTFTIPVLARKTNGCGFESLQVCHIWRVLE